MAKLIYSMIISLDGYAEASEGGLGTGAEDPEVHSFINDLSRPVGTYLYGRRMYETMLVLGDGAHRSRPAAAHPGLCARLAGGGQDRVLDDAGVGREREHEARAVFRCRGGAHAQGGVRSRHHRRRPEPGGPGDRRRSGGRVPAVHHHQRGRRRQAVLPRRRAPRSRPDRGACVRQRSRSMRATVLAEPDRTAPHSTDPGRYVIGHEDNDRRNDHARPRDHSRGRGADHRRGR